ncbi:DUF1987 domain-containing protein [Brenneria sp. 4F2]|nr:DUF1987 domain-containing protein [Brenneria bubanii]
MANIINMENLHIAGTPCTPAVDFYFDTHRLSLAGESYPENAAAFYRPLIERIQDYLDLLVIKSDAAEAALPPTIEFHISLVYFNSSSTKMLFGLFNVLSQAAQRKLPITLHWYYDQDDDIAEEFGEELHIDFPALDFHSHVLE